MSARTSLTPSDHNQHAKIPPLSSQFFSNLIKLETAFLSNNYTAETLEGLAQCYGQAIEYYDSIRDNISSYFMYKIQDMLLAKRSMKLLKPKTESKSMKNSMILSQTDLKETKETESQGKTEPVEGSNSANVSLVMENSIGNLISPTNKVRISFAPGLGISQVISEKGGDDESSEEEGIENDDDEEEDIPKRKVTMNRPSNQNQSMEAMMKSKQRMYAHQMQLQKAKQTEKNNLKTVITSFSGLSQNNDQIVLNDINAQKDRIRSIMARRQKERIMNYTQLSGFSPVRVGKFEDVTMESVLKALDNEESMHQSKENMEEMLENHSNEEGSSATNHEGFKEGKDENLQLSDYAMQATN